MNRRIYSKPPAVLAVLTGDSYAALTLNVNKSVTFKKLQGFLVKIV